MVGPGDEVAGRYRIDGALVTGAIGILFSGRDERTGEPVLVATPRSSDEADRFERNLRAAAALTHPSVARPVERSRDGDTPYALVELDDSEPFDRILDGEGAPEPRSAIRIAIQVLQALEHAHAAGISHGSLGPSAVLVSDGDRARVAGFGLSVGDPRDDLLATGKLLDEMLRTGRPPELDGLMDRATGTTTPFATASEMRRALEDARVRIAAVEEQDGGGEEEPATTVWPIPDARYDPATLGRRVIAAMIVISLIAGAAFLWRVLTRAEELREQRENSPTPSVTTSAETLGLP